MGKEAGQPSNCGGGRHAEHDAVTSLLLAHYSEEFSLRFNFILKAFWLWLNRQILG